MINVVDRYFSINRTLLLIIGLWPYEKSKFTGLQVICISSIFITCVIFQLTTFVTSKYSTRLIIKVLSITFPIIGLIIKYNSFYINNETLKNLMEQFQFIYNGLRDNNEIAIVEKYGENAKQYTVGLIMLGACGLPIFIGIQLWSKFIDVILSTNVSRSHQLQIPFEYFIDQEKYFYLPLFHINVTVILACTEMIATGAILIAYLQHACGMFKIASYRIEKAIQIYKPENINMQNKILIYKGIIHAVNIHRQAITFSNYLISEFEMTFMLLIVFGVLTLSFNIFRISQILLIRNIIEELPVHLMSVFIATVYMFVSNLVGQEIIDHNNHVFITVYTVRWYVTPVSIQKLLVILLQRGNKKFGLSVGGLFLASLECFATLINASVSYFTLMYSVQ